MGWKCLLALLGLLEARRKALDARRFTLWPAEARDGKPAARKESILEWVEGVWSL
jgi:hypothetical protein